MPNYLPVTAMSGERTIGSGSAAYRAASPCRVVYEVERPDARGFAYGTLPGHPATGEEVTDRYFDAMRKLAASTG